VSFCYVLLRWLLEFVTLCAKSKDFKDLEIIILRHELAILRRTTRRPSTTAVDRMFLGRGEPVAATRALAILHRHAGDPAALASTPDREAVDVCPSGRSAADAA
jgi:hypothetical protein